MTIVHRSRYEGIPMAGRWTKARLVASCGVLVGGMWGASMAVFTGEASTSASFSAGTVDINASDASTTLSMSDMAPGDSVTAPVTVSNGGSLDLRYSMSTTATSTDGATTTADASNAMAKALAVEIRQAAAEADCTDANWANLTTSVATGALDVIAIGDPTTGQQAGDRSLATAQSEVLCFQVTFDVNAADDLQGDSANATFTFNAESL